jgi:hypothetical protein
MNQVELDSGEMHEFLQHIIDNNRYVQENGKKPVAVEVIGESGLGKTSVVIETAKKNNLDCVKLNLAQIEELGDLVGFPVRQFQLCKGGPAGTKTVMKKVIVEGKEVLKKVEVPNGDGNKECIWVDENATEQYTKQGYEFTGLKKMSYCPPEWIADKTGGGILILDDWNRADIRFIQAVMEIVDRQEYISWKLPKDWHILLTANPDNGEYLVNTIDNAQRTRFVSVVMKWSHERWAEWAEEEGIDGRCINFVLMNEEVVNTKVNPRSITTFFNCISSYPKFEDHLPMIKMIGEGSVGPDVSTLFVMFINNRLDKLITPRDILLGRGNESVRDKLLSAICDGKGKDGYRGDIASILTTRLINFAVTYSSKNPITPEILDRVSYLIKDPDVFTDDLKYHLVKKILNGNKQKFAKLLFDTEIQELATK